MRPAVFPHPPFADHALLDSGGGEKLERFGPVVLRRPDPQALWRPRLAPERWAAADLAFVRESDRGGRFEARRGGAREAQGRDPAWTVGYGGATFVVRPTPFKHVGLFPEQAANWEWLRRVRPGLGAEPALLDLFAYTGAASVLAAKDGFRVTHVDASKASLAWARENAARSGLAEGALRLVLEDALQFAEREARRGHRYEAVLVDPPHYGRGPKGEKWQLEEGLAPLLSACRALLAERAVLVLSTYAVGYSPLAFENLLAELELDGTAVGELALPEEGSPRRLPCGYCARGWRGVDGG